MFSPSPPPARTRLAAQSRIGLHELRVSMQPLPHLRAEFVCGFVCTFANILAPRIRLTHGSGDSRYSATYNGAAKAVYLDVGLKLLILLFIKMRYFSPFLRRIPDPLYF